MHLGGIYCYQVMRPCFAFSACYIAITLFRWGENMAKQIYVRRDTKAWIAQVWIAFVMSLLLCLFGVVNLPLEGIYQVFLATGFFFTLFSSFVLAKSIRDNQHEKIDTPMWRLQVWLGFGLSVSLTTWGIMTMKMELWQLAYMVASGLFLISSTFTLSKTIRDNFDADILERGGASLGEDE